MGRFAVGLDTPSAGELARADINRDGVITISDWVKCGRIIAGLDRIGTLQTQSQH